MITPQAKLEKQALKKSNGFDSATAELDALTPQTRAQWMQELAAGIADAESLLAAVGLSERKDLLEQIEPAQQAFKTRVPRNFVARMEYGNALDPLLLQALPQANEGIHTLGYSTDPVGDDDATVTQGVIHKYQSRVLLMASSACAINCRYCFRRHYPYDDSVLSLHDWQAALDYIAQDDSIEEVILSGGDPLMLSDKKLQKLIAALASIAHISRLRIHSRLPIVLPNRVTESLCQTLSTSRLDVVMVIHGNHANELNEEVAQALAALKRANVVLLNQSVLLKNINDSVDTLVALSQRLITLGVIPYYLHLLDKAQGTAHFDVSEAKGKALIDAMRRGCSGYLVPRLVREQTGKPHKTIVL